MSPARDARTPARSDGVESGSRGSAPRQPACRAAARARGRERAGRGARLSGRCGGGRGARARTPRRRAAGRAARCRRRDRADGPSAVSATVPMSRAARWRAAGRRRLARRGGSAASRAGGCPRPRGGASASVDQRELVSAVLAAVTVVESEVRALGALHSARPSRRRRPGADRAEPGRFEQRAAECRHAAARPRSSTGRRRECGRARASASAGGRRRASRGPERRPASAVRASAVARARRWRPRPRPGGATDMSTSGLSRSNDAATMTTAPATTAITTSGSTRTGRRRAGAEPPRHERARGPPSRSRLDLRLSRPLNRRPRPGVRGVRDRPGPRPDYRPARRPTRAVRAPRRRLPAGWPRRPRARSSSERRCRSACALRARSMYARARACPRSRNSTRPQTLIASWNRPAK